MDNEKIKVVGLYIVIPVVFLCGIIAITWISLNNKKTDGSIKGPWGTGIDIKTENALKRIETKIDQMIKAESPSNGNVEAQPAISE